MPLDAASAAQASTAEVIDWDEDVGILMEEESEDQISMGEEIASQLEAVGESEENQEDVLSNFDVGDLFEDEEGGE